MRENTSRIREHTSRKRSEIRNECEHIFISTEHSGCRIHIADNGVRNDTTKQFVVGPTELVLCWRV